MPGAKSREVSSTKLATMQAVVAPSADIVPLNPDEWPSLPMDDDVEAGPASGGNNVGNNSNSSSFSKSNAAPVHAGAMYSTAPAVRHSEHTPLITASSKGKRKSCCSVS